MNEKAWNTVAENIERTRTTHLRRFFADDPKRAKKFTASAAGWSHLHTIPLGRRGDRVLMAFSRGDTELTVMVARRGVAKSAFSCGVSAKEKGRK